LIVAEYFLWALAVHFTVWFTGRWKRWKRTEYNLPRLVEEGALSTAKYGRRIVYTLPGKRTNNTQDIEHGIICTESLLRFRLSQPGEIISERFFRSLSFEAVPEWGVIYPSGNMLLFEYSTSDNCRRSRVMRKKADQYRSGVRSIEDYFEASPLVLFVLDVPQHSVKGMAQKLSDNGNQFYFVDLKTFMGVEIGKQLTAPIYIWGGDGEKYPLTES
jgi:hypothetical protein